MKVRELIALLQKEDQEIEVADVETVRSGVISFGNSEGQWSLNEKGEEEYSIEWNGKLKNVVFIR